ncbi:MAG: DNA repair protein RadC, partial [Spirochaetaceae bacterium]|nr:DNA repair protein RadC [Spirochaetaceae bacterium]
MKKKQETSNSQKKPRKAKKPDIREKIESQGIQSLSNTELIALLLRVGTPKVPVMKLAEEVVPFFDKEKEGKDLTDKLVRIPGMGKSKSAVIMAAMELGRRKFGSMGVVIEGAADIYPIVSHFSVKKQEYFICISLNGAHEVLAVRVVSIGTLNKTMAHPREVYADAVAERAAAVIICHNHPSGKLIPSVSDINITRRIKDAGDILGVPLLD